MQARQTINIFFLLCFLFSLFAQAQDTINITDNAGLKQGRWVIFGKSKPNTCYKADQKVEEGYYYDNKKGGTWYQYFCNEKIRAIIEFKNGKPNGNCKTFHENGTINEVGTFVLNKWVGEYTLHYQNGKPQQVFTFNEQGKRDGLQKYYFTNGNLQVIAIEGINKTAASLQFDSLGKLTSTGLNGKSLKEDDKISDEDKKLINSLKEIASKENKVVAPTKPPSKKQETTKPVIQDINFKHEEIQKRN